jgi:hypothetical protein
VAVAEKKKKSLMEEIAEMKNPKPTQVMLLPSAVCCLLSAVCCLLSAVYSLGPDDTSSNFPYTPPALLVRAGRDRD